MRKTFGQVTVVVIIGAALSTACKKDPPAEKIVVSTVEVDGLWNLAPKGARGGVVASSKAIGMVEDGLAMVRGAIARAPELAFLKDQLDAAFTQLAGSPQATLADIGLTRAKGAAIFAAKDGEMVAILPVIDREKFLGKVNGTKGATVTDPDTIGDITCKSVKQVYACAKPAAMLDTLGEGGPGLAGHLSKVAPARGDIEMIGAELPVGGDDARGGTSTATVVQVLQLERGGGTLRGTFVGVPADVAKRLAGTSKPRAESMTSASFAVLDLRAFLADIPLADLLGPEVATVLSSISGPITVTVPAGENGFDARVPISDGAAAGKLVDNCTSLPGIGPVASLEDGVCHFAIPNANMEIDLWLDADKKTLRIGKKALKTGAPATLTRVGRELATGSWSLAFWGRGTVMGESPMPGIPGSVDPQTAMMLRALAVVNELGIGVRVDKDKLEYIATMRTIFANPDAVVAKLLEITPDDIAAARAGEKAKAIAGAHGSAPFAQDYKSGQMGLAIPYMMIGMVAAVAIPAFMDSMKKAKKTEAEILLNKIGKSVRIAALADGAFPKLDLPLTPTTPCCGSPDNKCVGNVTQWAAWDPLDFAVIENHYYRYSYKSDGQTFVATAVGDLDCDLIESTYELRGKLDGGQPVLDLIPPSSPD